MRQPLMPDFKYDELYRAVAQTGVTCPPISSLQAINRIEAYRYVFADTSNNFNHKPVGVIQPQRLLQVPNDSKCQYYSLSCFEKKEGAIERFKQLREFNRNIKKTLGDRLCGGFLDANDGLKSEAGRLTHFELFEYTTCDLSQKFAIIESLP